MSDERSYRVSREDLERREVEIEDLNAAEPGVEMEFQNKDLLSDSGSDTVFQTNQRMAIEQQELNGQEEIRDSRLLMSDDPFVIIGEKDGNVLGSPQSMFEGAVPYEEVDNYPPESIHSFLEIDSDKSRHGIGAPNSENEKGHGLLENEGYSEQILNLIKPSDDNTLYLMYGHPLGPGNIKEGPEKEVEKYIGDPVLPARPEGHTPEEEENESPESKPTGSVIENIPNTPNIPNLSPPFQRAYQEILDYYGANLNSENGNSSSFVKERIGLAWLDSQYDRKMQALLDSSPSSIEDVCTFLVFGSPFLSKESIDLVTRECYSLQHFQYGPPFITFVLMCLSGLYVIFN